jgi:hypothetical protein
MEETASQQENNNNNKMCIPKSATHQQKEMNMNLLPSAPEWIMPQPPGHQQKWKKSTSPPDAKPHKSSQHHLSTLATQETKQELQLQLILQHHQARRNGSCPVSQKVPMSKSPAVILFLSSQA